MTKNKMDGNRQDEGGELLKEDSEIVGKRRGRVDNDGKMGELSRKTPRRSRYHPQPLSTEAIPQ
jgi:hypothetical protein